MHNLCQKVKYETEVSNTPNVGGFSMSVCLVSSVSRADLKCYSYLEMFDMLNWDQNKL